MIRLDGEGMEPLGIVYTGPKHGEIVVSYKSSRNVTIISIPKQNAGDAFDWDLSTRAKFEAPADEEHLLQIEYDAAMCRTILVFSNRVETWDNLFNVRVGTIEPVSTKAFDISNLCLVPQAHAVILGSDKGTIHAQDITSGTLMWRIMTAHTHHIVYMKTISKATLVSVCRGGIVAVHHIDWCSSDTHTNRTYLGTSCTACVCVAGTSHNETLAQSQSMTSLSRHKRTHCLRERLLLAVGHDNGDVSLWSGKTHLVCQCHLHLHKGAISHINLLGDGNLVLVVTDTLNSVSLWALRRYPHCRARLFGTFTSNSMVLCSSYDESREDVWFGEEKGCLECIGLHQLNAKITQLTNHTSRHKPFELQTQVQRIVLSGYGDIEGMDLYDCI